MSHPLQTCVIADDHPGLVAAIAEFIPGYGFEVVGRASDGERTVELVASLAPDLALVDYHMPRLSGEELICRLHEVSPATRVLVYTGDVSGEVVAASLSAGASAVLLKESPLVDLVRALEAVRAGRPYVDPGLARTVIGHGRRAPQKLTPREVDVLRLIADGLSHEEIGERLSISPETVRTHLRKACERLNAATRTQAVATALRNGLLA